MKSNLTGIIKFIESKNAIKDKNKLTKLVSRRFKLIRDRSVYYNDEFAIRFCKSARPNLSNTILSLSNLRKVDDRPFIVCVVTPDKNYMYLANSTFLSFFPILTSYILEILYFVEAYQDAYIKRMFYAIFIKYNKFFYILKITHSLSFKD